MFKKSDDNFSFKMPPRMTPVDQTLISTLLAGMHVVSKPESKLRTPGCLAERQILGPCPDLPNLKTSRWGPGSAFLVSTLDDLPPGLKDTV